MISVKCFRWLTCAVDFELGENGKRKQSWAASICAPESVCVCDFVGGFLPMMAWLCCQFK